MSDRVAAGKLVSLTYSIRDDAGQVLEQSNLPVSYIQGGNSELIGGMDAAIAGKGAGDEVELDVAPEASGFGPYDPDLTFTDAVENVPPEFRRVGAEVPMQSDAGETRTFYVTRIADGRLTVDGNHPLAGKRLRVRIRIQDVREPSAADVQADAADDAPATNAGTLH
jgi:FKBP-type peptidyl-prolyl cis-trans isomerase SlyD